MSLKNAALALLLGLFALPAAHAEILFEAFYRIEKGGRHTGYMIQRLASDTQGRRIMSTYIRTKNGDNEVYTTSKSIAKKGKAEPVETVHGTNRSGAPYHIVTKFNGGKGTVSYHSNNARQAGMTVSINTAPVPSSFMYFITDFAKFQPGKKYVFTAYFEESGRAQIGHLSLLGAKEAAQKRVFQLLNDDSGQPVESFVTDGGEPLGSRSISTDTVVFWVAGKDDAVADMTYPTGEMTKLFGDLPQGRKNSFAKVPGFKAIDVIQGFTIWTGDRAVSSPSPSEVLPLPLRPL